MKMSGLAAFYHPKSPGHLQEPLYQRQIVPPPYGNFLDFYSKPFYRLAAMEIAPPAKSSYHPMDRSPIPDVHHHSQSVRIIPIRDILLVQWHHKDLASRG